MPGLHRRHFYIKSNVTTYLLNPFERENVLMALIVLSNKIGVFKKVFSSGITWQEMRLRPMRHKEGVRKITSALFILYEMKMGSRVNETLGNNINKKNFSWNRMVPLTTNFYRGIQGNHNSL